MEEVKRAETQEEQTGVAVVPDSGTKIPKGAYVVNLTKPFTYEDRTYHKFIFDFEGLIGEDMLDIENEMTATGELMLSPEVSTGFMYRMAAKAAGVASDVISHLPARDFWKVKSAAQIFLTGTGSEGRTL